MKNIKPQLGTISVLDALRKAGVKVHVFSYWGEQADQVVQQGISYYSKLGEQEQDYGLFTDYSLEMLS